MRLKLFENFEDSKELLKWVQDCFADMEDDDECEIVDDSDEGEIMLVFNLDTNYKSTSFSDFLSFKKIEFDRLEKINQTLIRLGQLYNGDYDIDLETELDENGYVIILRITPGVAKEGEFYKVTEHGIKFNQGKLISMLNLPKSTELGLSYGGGVNHLSFKFQNEADLKRYKDKLIEEFLKLKIEGKPLCVESKFSWSSSTGDEMLKYKVHQNEKRNYHGPNGSGSEKINSVEFGLNSELEYW